MSAVIRTAQKITITDAEIDTNKSYIVEEIFQALWSDPLKLNNSSELGIQLMNLSPISTQRCNELAKK